MPNNAAAENHGVLSLTLHPDAARTTIRYRADIDGLRALAVIAVVLFHLGFAGLPGGFVGVDVFFVISGYLISAILFAETARGEYSVLRFYERRARRILPALVVVLTLSFAAGLKLFFPGELASLAASTLASVLFAANIFFYATSGYFAPTADRLPLLHLWSLGVEEQFYLVFPLLLLAANKLRRRDPIIIVFCLISFVASAGLTHRHPTAAFYLLPFRAFELMIGSIVALPSLSPPWGPKTALTATAAGLAAIVTSIVFFRSDLDFPGFAAMLPCLGTAMVIWAGIGTPNAISRALGWAPITALGKVSYSLYLVHWPIIVFGNLTYPHSNILARNTLYLLISIGLATIMYWCVEQPFRTRVMISQGLLFATALSTIVIVCVLAGGTILGKGFPRRFDTRLNDLLAYLQYSPAIPFREGRCFMRPEQSFEDLDRAMCTPRSSGRTALLWGDSTAAHLYAGLVSPLRAAGYSLSQETASACAPVKDYDAPNRPNCKNFNIQVYTQIISSKPDLVILASSWPLDTHELDLFSTMLIKIHEAGVRAVIVGPAPYYEAAVPKLLADRLQRRQHGTLTEGEVLPGVWMTDARMRAFSRQLRIPYVSIMDQLCPSARCAMETTQGVPIEFDRLHFTIAGSDLVGQRIAPLILRP